MAEVAGGDDPIKFVYNVTPKTKILQGKSAIPSAFHYSPQEKIEVPLLEYSPLTCSCQAVFNPYCDINFNLKTAKCCFCGNSSQLPPNYAQHITPNKLPYEFMSKNTTLEFRSGAKVTNYRYGYLFVIDINIQQKQLASIRQELSGVISRMPGHYNVGIITYGKNVHIYDFSTRINTNYCINGVKQYNLSQIMGLIGITVKNDANSQSSDINKKFIVPISEYRQALMNRIKNIKPDNQIYVNERKHSCFGQALSISISMAQVSTISTRIVYLVGNPCTVGVGVTLSPNLKDQMRSPEELSKGQNIPYFVSAKKFYDSFIKRAISRHIPLDIFIFTCNQIGFTQMSDLFISTGGFVVMHEQFRDRIFRESFPKIFLENNEEIGDEKMPCVTQGVLFVHCSKDIAINGALGQCHSLEKSKSFVSDKVVGKGNTHAWYFGSIDPCKSITIVYEIKEGEAKQQNCYFQIKTVYKNLRGESVTRVTTVKRQFSSQVPQIIQGFDEEAAAVLLARMCVNKMLYEEQKNIRQWLDQILVKWAQNYANYIKNDETSFSLPQNMRRLPQMVYHLRRSHFVNRFGISLDQSYYKGYNMNRQSVINCLSMIQPALLSYSLSESSQPQPVQLNEQQMKDDVILLLDTYFVVLQWYGQTTKSWFDQGFHEQEGYEHIAQLFNSPKIDIDYIMKYRFPVPNYYLVHPYHSKERYLKSRVNPKKSLGEQHENMLTDDSDLKGFTQHLIRVVVKQT